MSQQVPLVNYLSLVDDPPTLVATVCSSCGAMYFGRRIACARCGKKEFHATPAARTGTIGSFSIIHRAPKGVPAPFASAIIDLDDGGFVKANIVGCPADPEHVRLGMPVELTTFGVGADENGTVAIAFAFAPAERRPHDAD